MYENMGQTIAKLRRDRNLTQEKLAEQLAVSAQAVSKWENGKNIPDIALLKEICNDYGININDLLDGKVNNKKVIIIVSSIIGFLIVLGVILLIVFHDDSFTFRTLTSNCSNFEISGSIAYNKSNSYLYISNIDYCGGTDDNLYTKIECSLYEESGTIKKKIGSYDYDDNVLIKLNDFLKNVNFNIDNFGKECKNIESSNILLEINATDSSNKITTYKVPLSLNGNCS